MLFDLTKEDLDVLYAGLGELPIKTGVNTFLKVQALHRDAVMKESETKAQALKVVPAAEPDSPVAG